MFARTLALVIAVGAALVVGQPPKRAEELHPTAAVAAEQPPNIVVVMADDMRVDDLRFAPRIRELIAESGVTFENSFSPYPLCCPARASFLTGTYAHNHQVYWYDAPYAYGSFDDSRTIATSLRQVGYTTGFIGKYLNRYGIDRSLVSGRPSARYVPRGWSRWLGAIQNPGRWGVHGGTYNYFDIAFNRQGTIDNRYRGRYQTNVLGDFSVGMAREFARAPEPFFMYVNFVAPHHGVPSEPDDPAAFRLPDGQLEPYLTPARPDWVKGRFDQVVRHSAGLPSGGGQGERDVSDKPVAFRVLPPVGAAGRRALAEVTRQRAEAVYVMDGQVARLVRALKSEGAWQNTWFVFTSDNGYFLGEHRMRQGKLFAHEPSLRVPLLITGPGHRTAEQRYDPISTVDLTATLLELAGARAPRPADGLSRVATIEQGDQGWDVPMVTEALGTSGPREKAWHGPRTSIGLRTARYSFTRYRNGETELYDLATDPLQLTSLDGDPAYEELREVLLTAWQAYRACAGAACRRAGPETLRATAEETREVTRDYWEVVRATYGW